MVAVAAEVAPIEALEAIAAGLGWGEYEYVETLGSPDPLKRALLAEALVAALPAIIANLEEIR